MHAFTTILAAASLASSAAAICMLDFQAQKVATNFATLIHSYSAELANQTLTTDYVDYSDSVTTLINSGCTTPETLGVATFDSRAAFEAGQGSQPSIPFEQLNLWHNCDTVFLRWRTALTPEFVTGIIILETTPQLSLDEPFLIKTVYSEFNSGAWLVDLDVFKPTNCSSGTKRLLRL